MVSEKSRNVHEFRMEYSGGWEQWFLLTADDHFDNPKSDRKLIRTHLLQARERGARVMKYGDVFCLMQGKGDKRGSKSDILPQHNTSNYIDSVIDEGIDFYGEFADIIDLITPGNHETAMIKYHETNPTERLVRGINQKFNPENKVFMGGFSGWNRFMFSMGGGKRLSKKLWYHHGHGGGGVVTKGVIQQQRRALFVSDADIVATGHVHESVVTEWPKIRLSSSGVEEQFIQTHITLPTYKEEYVDGFGGWHIERGAGPKPLGAFWIKFYYKSGGIHFDILRAK